VTLFMESRLKLQATQELGKSGLGVLIEITADITQ